MAKGYIIVTEDIHTPEGMAEYGKLAGPTIAAHSAKPVVVGAPIEVLEGEWPATQTVVLEFDSVEAARAWYESPEYQAAAKLRQAAANSNAILIAGIG